MQSTEQKPPFSPCETSAEDTYVKNYLVIDGEKLKARIEVKVRSKAKPIIKDYDLPFSIDL